MKCKETIPIFFTVDGGYAPYLDCAIRSIMANADRRDHYEFIVLYEDLPEESMEKLKTGIEPPFHIQFLPMQDKVTGITERPENLLRCDYFTMTIYFRIFIADLFPEYDKGIYIDSDVIVPGDISELYHTDLADNLIAACPDYSVMAIPELNRHMEYNVGVPKQEYVNSGVLCMNLKLMREVHFCDHFLMLLNTYHFDGIAPDQDYINAMCNGRIVYLEERWDTMPPEEGKRTLLAHPMLIHYNLFQKPWCYDDIPYEEYFWHYAEQSPFYQDILRDKANYSEEQKASDAEALARLIHKSGIVDQNEVTFRKIQEKEGVVRI